MDPVGGGPKTQSQGCYRGSSVVDAPVGEAPVVPPLVNDSDDWRFRRSASDRSSGGFEPDHTIRRTQLYGCFWLCEEK